MMSFLSDRSLPVSPSLSGSNEGGEELLVLGSAASPKISEGVYFVKSVQAWTPVGFDGLAYKLYSSTSGSGESGS